MVRQGNRIAEAPEEKEAKEKDPKGKGTEQMSWNVVGSVCPVDQKTCCDDLCHGGGCIRSNGEPMWDVCGECHGYITDFDGCSCDEGFGDPQDQEEWGETADVTQHVGDKNE